MIGDRSRWRRCRTTWPRLRNAPQRADADAGPESQLPSRAKRNNARRAANRAPREAGETRLPEISRARSAAHSIRPYPNPDLIVSHQRRAAAEQLPAVAGVPAPNLVSEVLCLINGRGIRVTANGRIIRTTNAASGLQNKMTLD